MSNFLGTDYFGFTSGGSGGGGASGSSGTSGQTFGTSGTSGMGTSGTSGSAGTSASSGSSGTAGLTGTAGTSASSGSSGSSGTSGSSGSSGASGTVGTSGSSGTSALGSSGTSGSSGSAGTSGVSASGTLKTYTVVLNTVNGALNSVASATDPVGANLIGASGWTFTIDSGSQFTIVHPLGNVITGAWTNGVNGANVLTRTFTGNTTGNYSMFQDSGYTQVTFYSLSGTLAGYATVGASTMTIYFFAKV